MSNVENPIPLDVRKYTKPSGAIVLGEDRGPAFVPDLLPPPIRGLYDEETVVLLAEAERKVGQLAGMAHELVNLDVLIWVCHKREAVIGSKIEGTTASLKDFNMHESFNNIPPRAREAMRLEEVVNYYRALEFATNRNEKPSLEVAKKAHKILMGDIGKDPTPGKFRTGSNMIKKRQGSKIYTMYVPPPPSKISRLLQNLEIFMQTDNDQIPPLIQCAIAHYQFEAIHPFMDGNGRIGRLLLPIMLHDKGLMPDPLLYLGGYFEQHLDEYYDGLRAVRQKSQWKEWIKFFLRAFASQSDYVMDSIAKTASLQKKYVSALEKRRASQSAILLLGHLFANPYTTVTGAQRHLGVTYPTAKKAVFGLVDAGILRQIEAGTSKAFYAREIADLGTV